MSFRFAVVHEAAGDFLTATELADRVLVDVIDWLDEDQLALIRTWIGEGPDGNRLMWKAIKKLAAAVGIRVHGHFDGEPGEPDAVAARRAILYLLNVFPDVDAILLIRDQDDQPERRTGLEQARRGNKSGKPILVGLAIVEREAWAISGFEPKDEIETARIENERKKLGFNPCEKCEELTACKNDLADRSPKRVLAALTGNDRDRERRCWVETSLDVLRNRGTENGLVLFFNEIRDHLGNLIGHVMPPGN